MKSSYSRWFLLPGLILYATFFLVPCLVSFYFAFTNWNAYTSEASFIGFGNFARIFDDRILSTALRNTLFFGIATTIGKNVLGLALALYLNGKLKLRNGWRAVFFLPAVLSPIVIGLLFTAILHPEGLFNSLLGHAGLAALQREWLVDRDVVMWAVSGVEVWQYAGFHMAIFLAGLQSIPRQYYEASLVDGAGRWQTFRGVTLPLILPAFNISLITSMIGGFKVFTQVYVLTGGGPGHASEVLNSAIFRTLGEGQWGLGTAMNVVLFACIGLISLTTLAYLRRKEVEM